MSEVNDAKSYLDYLRSRADEMTETEIKGDYEEMIDVIRKELTARWNSIEDGVDPSKSGDYLVVYRDKTRNDNELFYGIFSWMVPQPEGMAFFNGVIPQGEPEWNMDLKAMINKENIKMLAWRELPFYCE